MPSIAVDGYEIAFVEAGAGPPLVMVHGTLGDQRSWQAQMEHFGARYRAVALSLRHCWPGGWAEGGDFTIDRHVADVAAVCRALGGGVRLVGHSRGGHIAFRVAERHGELLQALVLAEPGGELDESLGGKPAAGGQATAFAEGARRIAAGDVDGGLAVVVEHSGGPGAWERLPEGAKQRRRDNARTLIGQVHEDRRPFSRAAAAAIGLPTLLLNGARTEPHFVAICDALAGAMPRAERATVPEAGHSMQQENPAAFNAAVLEWLGRQG